MKKTISLLLVLVIVFAFISVAFASNGLDRALERAGNNAQGKAPEVLEANRAKQAWEGDWDTTFADETPSLTLYRDGNNVTGEYEYGVWYGYIDGTLSEDGYTLTGTWDEYHTSGWDAGWGSFEWVLGAELNSFTGTWGLDESADDGGYWNGVRAE